MPIMQHDKESNDLSSGRSLRVLFADDEPSIQELMRLELPRFGHEVTICPDGVTALTVLDQSEFDCVIVDLDMPGACLLYTSPSPRDRQKSRMPSSA